MNEITGEVMSKTKVNGPIITTPLGGKYGYTYDSTYYAYVATLPPPTSYSTSISSLYKIDVGNGRVLWRHPMPSKITNVITTCVSDICTEDPVFVSDNKWITALKQPDLDEGDTGVTTTEEQVLWEYAPEDKGDDYTFNAMSLSNDGTVLFATFAVGAGSCIHAIFTADASLKWELCYDDWKISPPARRVHGNDDLLFIGYKSEMHAVTTAAGELKWKVKLGDNIDQVLIWNDGKVLYATTRGAGTKIYSINVEEEAEAYMFDIKTKVSTFPSSGSIGTLYIGSGHYLHEIVDEDYAGYENCGGESEEGEECERAVNEWCLPAPMRRERQYSLGARSDLVVVAVVGLAVFVAAFAMVVVRRVQIQRASGHRQHRQQHSDPADPVQIALTALSTPALVNSAKAFEML
jgi:hypothetical protein